MLTAIIVLPILAALVTAYVFRRDMGVDMAFTVAVAVIATIGIVLLASTVIEKKVGVDPHAIEFDPVPIVALTAVNSMDGSFTVGTGVISGRPHYFLFLQRPDRGKELVSIRSDMVIVYEGEDVQKPVLTKALYRKKWSTLHPLLFFIVPPLMRTEAWTGHYVMRVPVGSIAADVRFDLPR